MPDWSIIRLTGRVRPDAHIANIWMDCSMHRWPTNRRIFRIAIPALLLTTLSALLLSRDPHVFLAGDSTMADKPVINNMERGWGQMFPLLFNRSVEFRNHARNGRSTKSFLTEGRWRTVADSVQPGDYVFIQFGHNDEKLQDSTRYADPQTAFPANLARFVRETREKSAIPILLTPVNRRYFNDEGKIKDVHGPWATAVRLIAQREHVPLIDLEALSRSLFDSLGVEETKTVFLWVPPGLYKNLPEGKQDNTHFTKPGAFLIAQLVARSLRALKLPLASSLKPCTPDSLPGLGFVVGLDNFFNNEWKTGPDGSKQPFHYVWEDTANSGFSILGTILDALGYTLTSVCQTPTREILAHLAIYLIVDPDTPKETEHPNYMSAESAGIIEEWVRGGGILLLLANDTGNCDLAHLNILSKRFGIRFNEDSHHQVQGKEYEAGANADLPDHPIFSGVRKIFTKEISSLTLTEPARPLLAEGNLVLMGLSSVGKGLVFAVGDPWFYNEYMDQRRLPEDFDNAHCARGLFEWLPKQIPDRALRQNRFFMLGENRSTSWH
jgi:lysophospholipase L1-like esterase